MFLAPTLLILLGLAARLALGLAYGVRGPDPSDVIYQGVRFFSWATIGCGCAIWCLLSIGALPILLMLGVLAGFAVVDAVRSSRETHRRTVSKLLAVAMREGRLKESLELLDHLRPGWFVGQAVGHLADELQSGQQLYEAVARNKSALPREAAAYAAIGTLVSAEPEALDELGEPDHPQLARAWRWWFDHGAYTAAMVLTMGLLVGVFFAFVIPQFYQIFWEFDLELPAVTDFLFAIADDTWVWSLLVFFTELALLAAFIIGVLYLLELPVFRGVSDLIMRRLHTAEVLRMLALAMEHRAELPRALYALSVTHPVRAVRNRMSTSYQDVAAGQPWAEVLMHNRLLSPNDKGLAETAAAAGNLPWALRQIAMRRESRFAAVITFLGHLSYPLVILFFSAFVAFICIALFIPIVKLIEGLS